MDGLNIGTGGLTVRMERNIMDMIATCIEILEKTNDGNDLAPWHLKLVELATNSGINEAGERAMADLLANVRTGYKKPCHLGIKYMTKDCENYIYYKGKNVEHYTFHNDPGQKRERKALRKLQRNMMFLESIGREPTLGNYWKWEAEQQQESSAI